MQDARYRIAIDVGGTFTDIVLLNLRSGEVAFGKVATTPADPSRGSLEGASAILEQAAVPVGHIRDVVHATTVATNAVLERRGARTGLVTTEGFRDVLEMGREGRYDIYDLDLRVPDPLVPRARRVEVPERLDATGRVVRELDEAAAEQALRPLCADGRIESLALCLLHSHLQPEHERRLAALAQRLFPDVALSVSSDVAGELREYERTSTTVVDAYVKPMVQGYVTRLSQGLRALRIEGPLSMMLSHGGVAPADEVASRFPVRMIESGPAAGAIAAGYVARHTLDPAHALAFDMGGTTAKISVVRHGAARVTHEYEVAHVHRFKRGSGLPLQISAVELLEIGAGGGSIAHVGMLGLLNVGPASAGAVPGPACYARGGEKPTVTDADLILGYLDPVHFLGGDMPLNPALSRRAIEQELCGCLGMTVEDVAWGIHDVVNEKMAAAVRAHAAEVGIDLRQHAMIAFGGAGPVHAYALARKLDIARLVYPFGAGVASAIGGLVAPPAFDSVTAFPMPLTALSWPELVETYDSMRAEGERMLAGLCPPGEAARIERSVDLRCEGQGYAITVPLKGGLDDREGVCARLAAEFEATYEQIYGHRPPSVPIEVVNLRARIAYALPLPELRLRAPTGPARDSSPLKGERPVRFDAAGGLVPTPVLDRYRLPRERAFAGPAIVEERETSIVIGPAARFRMDSAGHLIVDLERVSESRP